MKLLRVTIICLINFSIFSAMQANTRNGGMRSFPLMMELGNGQNITIELIVKGDPKELEEFFEIEHPCLEGATTIMAHLKDVSERDRLRETTGQEEVTDMFRQIVDEMLDKSGLKYSFEADTHFTISDPPPYPKIPSQKSDDSWMIYLIFVAASVLGAVLVTGIQTLTSKGER
jgi:hypothetical protein